MDAQKTATATAISSAIVSSEVRSIEWYKCELEVLKRELETYKTLYWDLQLELDKIDEIRKKPTRYSTLRRQKAIEKLRLDFVDKHVETVEDCDCDCDCGMDEVDG